MNPKEILLKLGFKKLQAKIYLACLELGVSTGGKIAKKAGIQRTYFYDLIKDLIAQGYIIQTLKGKRRFFAAVDPKQLEKIQEDKLRMLKENIPELKSIYNVTGEKPKVTFYEGRKGIGEMYEDFSRYKREILTITNEKVLEPKNIKFTYDSQDKRVAAKTPIRVLAPVGKLMIQEQKKDKEKLREIRMLPKDLFSSEIEINMYGNKVNFINFNKEFGLVVENKEIVDTMRNLFELIWESGKIV